jgi:hypothetical protein
MHFNALLLGPDQKKVKDDKDQQQWRELQYLFVHCSVRP